MSETIKTKTCPKCKENLLVTEFTKRSAPRTGLRGWCKGCEYKNTKQYRQTTNGKSAIKKYNQSEKGKQNRTLWMQTEKGKQYVSINNKIHRRRYPQKRKAARLVGYAIYIGKLIPQAECRCKCGKQAEHYHHYLGYAPENWLDVVPVCQPCHRKLHLELNKYERTST